MTPREQTASPLAAITGTPATRDGARPHVVIVGGGFGGLNAAKALADAPVRITVVDRRNHHLFQPLLYQVATAALSPADIAAPIRRVLRKQDNVEVILADVTAIDAANRQVVFGDGRLEYDYLILATGASHAYFGHDEWEGVAPGLKSLEDALTIRRRVLLAFEEAERTTDQEARRALMTFVVVGGGPTGVEMAGALAEMARRTLANEFDRIDPATATVILIEGLDRLLPPFPATLGDNACQTLESLGVRVRTRSMVTHIDAGGVTIGEERIPARTVVWAAGVKASPVAASLGVELDRAGRVPVNPDLSIPGHPEIFVIGDLASIMKRDGQPIPGIAPAAIQGGKWAAANIQRVIAGQPSRPFRYRDLGNMAVIARNEAVVHARGIKLTGFVAWLAWAIVHVINLIGYRSRIQVTTQWLWSYVTSQRGARLITGEQSRETRER